MQLQTEIPKILLRQVSKIHQSFPLSIRTSAGECLHTSGIEKPNAMSKCFECAFMYIAIGWMTALSNHPISDVEKNEWKPQRSEEYQECKWVDSVECGSI